jgi:transcription initiation factor TFIID subunit 6
MKPPNAWLKHAICKSNPGLLLYQPYNQNSRILYSSFGDDYATLKSRVLKTLCDAVGPDQSLPTQYGGIVAISLFGPKAINAFILPLALDYWKRWSDSLARVNDLEQRMEVQMCQQATLNGLSVFLGPTNKEAPEAIDMEWEVLEDTFGDPLVMLSTNETEFALCFV